MNKKIEELLKVLDMSEMEQAVALFNLGHDVILNRRRIYWNWTPGEVPGLKSLDNFKDLPYIDTKTLALLAFELKEDLHDPLGDCAWDRACWEVWKYVETKQGSNVFERKHLSLETREKYCSDWMLLWAEPIHWVIAVLITKEIVANPEEKFDAHLDLEDLKEEESMKVTILKLNCKNLNGNLYTREVGEDIVRRINEGKVLGGIGYPRGPRIDLGNITHVVSNARIVNDEVVCNITFIGIEKAKTLQNMKDTFVFRTYGIGDIEGDGIIKNYQLISVDAIPINTDASCLRGERPELLRVLKYGIAQEYKATTQGNSYGFWDGPNPFLEEMLEVDGRDKDSVIFRFNEDGTDEVIFRWNPRSEEWEQIINHIKYVKE